MTTQRILNWGYLRGVSFLGILMAALGVHAYPTLLAADGPRVVPLAQGHATADEIQHRLAAVVGS